MHTAILCMNVEIDTNQFRRKRCAHYLIFLFSFSRFLSHTETNTRITLSFSLSLARFQNRKRLNELRNFIEKIIPQNIYTYAVVRVCRTYFTYRPKTESCTTMCSCVCVCESKHHHSIQFCYIVHFPLACSLSLPLSHFVHILSSMIITFLFPSIISCYLFLAQSKETKNVRILITVNYICSIMDFNRLDRVGKENVLW